MKNTTLFLLLISFCIQAFPQSESERKILFNGIYVSDPIFSSDGTDTTLYLLRFYEDKTVISSTFVYDNHNYESLFLWFTKESVSKETKGRIIDMWESFNDSIKFNINLNKIRVSNIGNIIDSNTLIVTTKSNKNKIPSTEKYHFKPIDLSPIKERKFPNDLNKGDIIKVTEYVKSHSVVQTSRIKEFELKESNQIELRYISNYANEYMFVRSGDYKGDYKHLKKEGNKFLRKNNIKLNKYYSEVDKPYKSLKGSWGDLQCNMPQTPKVDSVDIFTKKVLNEIEAYYDNIIRDDFTPPTYHISGVSKVYFIEIISKDEAYYLIQARELSNGGTLIIKTKPIK